MIYQQKSKTLTQNLTQKQLRTHDLTQVFDFHVAQH